MKKTKVEKVEKNKVNDRRMRLSVFRSNKFIYAQVIDDEKGHTLAHAKGKDAKEVGTKISELTLEKKEKKISFDRGQYRYHGKIKVLADAAREGGLEF